MDKEHKTITNFPENSKLTSQDSKQPSNFLSLGLSQDQFREASAVMTEYVINYHQSLDNRKTFPSKLSPGFLNTILPVEANDQPDPWQKVFDDIENVIMKGMTHWHSKGFFAYFSCGFSYPDILAEILIAATSAIGFSWASCPSLTELELGVMDWVAKSINLPSCFIYDHGKGTGAGCIQNTACDSTLVSLLAARALTVGKHLEKDENENKFSILSKLVCYTSKYSHCSVKKAGIISFVEMRFLDVDENISMRGSTLQKQIDEDKKQGLIPFYVCATLGTTVCASIDNINEIGLICKQENMWLHVDSAYLGSALVCPQFQHYGQGLEHATSINFNAHKNWMLSFPCGFFWVKDKSLMNAAFNIDTVYLSHKYQDTAIDYRHWQIPLSKKFSSIKVWFLMRMVGVSGIRKHVLNSYERACYFESLVRKDSLYEVLFKVTLGLVCFRIKPHHITSADDLNELNNKLYELINSSGEVHLTQSVVENKRFLRLAVSGCYNNCSDIDMFWKICKDCGNKLLEL